MTLEDRIDRLESIEEIRQLVSKYSLSLDMRDLDAHVNLFAEDIRVSRDATGRANLKKWLDDTLRLQFTGTSHHVGNHIIEFDDPDHAHGVLYSKNEHETPSESGDEWVIMQMLYWDNYERINGHWYFRRRLPCYWYATDLNKPLLENKKCDGLIETPMMVRFMIYFLHGKNSGAANIFVTMTWQNPSRLILFLRLYVEIQSLES